MKRLLVGFATVMISACGASPTVDAGSGGGSGGGTTGGGGGTTGGGGGTTGGGGGTTGGGGGTTGGGGGTTGGGGGATGGGGGITDGGFGVTLAGLISFAPIDGLAGYSTNYDDGGVIRSGLTAVAVDNEMGRGCTATVPNTITAKIFSLQFYNSDGGDVTPGAYQIITMGTMPDGLVAQATATEYTPLGMTTFGGAAFSGTATLISVSGARARGSFQTTAQQFSDGGQGSWSGTFDVPLCN